MQNCRVLIISRQRLFIESLSRLVQAAGARVVAQVDNLKSALAVLNNQDIEAIIIDHSEPQHTEGEILADLTHDNRNYKIIFLTPVNNQMIVYHRQQIKGVTPDYLGQVLDCRRSW